jgi:hypothetical protein
MGGIVREKAKMLGNKKTLLTLRYSLSEKDFSIKT